MACPFTPQLHQLVPLETSDREKAEAFIAKRFSAQTHQQIMAAKINEQSHDVVTPPKNRSISLWINWHKKVRFDRLPFRVLLRQLTTLILP
jgi:hypothetical protein